MQLIPPRYHLLYHTALEEFEVVNRARVNFNNGDTVGDVRCITIGIVDDTKVENDEYFNFTLSNGRGTQFNETSTRIYILEDDGMCMYVKSPLAKVCNTHNTSIIDHSHHVLWLQHVSMLVPQLSNDTLSWSCTVGALLADNLCHSY